MAKAILVRTIEVITTERVYLTNPGPRRAGESNNDWINRAEKIALRKKGKVLRKSVIKEERCVPLTEMMHKATVRIDSKKNRRAMGVA